MAKTYKCVTLRERPKAEIIPNETFKMEERPLPQETELKEGEVLVQNLYLSLDPAMRGWLNDARSYIAPVKIGAIMRGQTVGRVLASKSAKVKPNQLVSLVEGWTEVCITNAKNVEVLDLPSGTRPSDALGILGPTSLTAYFGLFDVGKPKPGDLCVVSGAAGATGSMVVQFALITGCRVVAIAGTEDDKCEWLKSLGCEAALNYKHADFKKQFRTATKGFINVFFDNVGGEILDLALARAAPFARFVQCGAISNYNTEASAVRGPSNYMNIISQRIKWQGFVVFDYADRYPEALKQITKWLEAGKLQRREHIVRGGLAAAPQALVELYKGINTGKLLVELASEPTSKL